MMSCDCSICSRKGSLLWFAPREKFRLLTPQERLGTYTFNKHVFTAVPAKPFDGRSL